MFLSALSQTDARACAESSSSQQGHKETLGNGTSSELLYLHKETSGQGLVTKDDRNTRVGEEIYVPADLDPENQRQGPIASRFWRSMPPNRICTTPLPRHSRGTCPLALRSWMGAHVPSIPSPIEILPFEFIFE